MSLGSAPAAPVAGADVEFGTYRGSCASTDLDFESRVGRYTRIRHEKRWQRFWVADSTVALGGAIVAIGPVGVASLWVFDREEQELLVDTSTMLPPFAVRIDNNPTATPTATARFLDCRIAVGQRGDRLHVLGRMDGTRLTFGYETPAADPVTAVCPIDTGSLDDRQGVNITQKSACLPVSGWINADGRRYRFGESAVGMLDYSHGLLGRETTWQWAIAAGDADGASVGFNVVESFNEGLENVIWVDGVPRSIGRATMSFEGDSEWHVETADGELSVTLTTEGVRCQSIDLGPFSWASNQPLGRWHGTIGNRAVEGIYGVAESHRSKW